MPILQSRVLAIISAGRDYQRALKRVQQLIIDAEKEANASDQPFAHAQALQQLQMDSQELFLLSHPLESGKILDIEEAKLLPKTIQRNEKARARIAKLRREKKMPSEAQGIPQGPRLQGEPVYGITLEIKQIIDADAAQAMREIEEAEGKGAERTGLVQAEEGQVPD